MSASQARMGLYKLIDRVSESHVPLLITGKRNNAILVSEEDWSSIQEMMYIMSIPGLEELKNLRSQIVTSSIQK
jgi:prevent-host-death family protein